MGQTLSEPVVEKVRPVCPFNVVQFQPHCKAVVTEDFNSLASESLLDHHLSHFIPWSDVLIWDPVADF